MKHLLKFNWLYFVLALIIFSLEIIIAIYAHDQIIRPYIGDFLVVMLIYCFIKSFIDLPVVKTALSVLIFSYFLEMLQYFHIVTILRLQNSAIAKTIIGTSFEWTDLVAYTTGIAVAILLEKIFARNILKRSSHLYEEN